MSVKSLFTKRVCRYTCAALASAVTTFIAMNSLSYASAQTCNLHDATRWQLALNDAEVEQTPEYIRSVTEAFLKACPERPEFAEASRIAGIAAADTGDASAAVRHFQNAGWMRDLLSNFYTVSSYLASGEDKAAWRHRDQMVEMWRTRLDRHPQVSVTAQPTELGMIYQVYFSKPDEDSSTRAAWIAVPYGPGWPATLTFSKDRMRLAMRKISLGDVDEGFRYVDLQRCQGRRFLGRIETTLSVTDFDGAAQAGLLAYLADPDLAIASSNGQIRTCVMPSRLLPSTPKR